MKILYFLLFISLLTFGNSQTSLTDYYSFESDDGRSLNLQERMKEQGVTGLSGIVIYKDKVEYITEGVLSESNAIHVSRETLFPVGALSIYPAIIELHRLVALGKISLDDPVINYIPELKDDRKNKSEEFTLEDLILFKMKLNGPYKPKGYESSEKLIYPEEILTNGNQDYPKGVKILESQNKSANSNCTAALLLQVLLERHHKRPLAEIIDSTIFQPLGMNNSFYASELSDEQEALVPDGHIKGKALSYKYRRYGLQAAMCLWTTPTDYAKLVQHVYNASKGKDNSLIPAEIAQKGLIGQHEYHSYIFHSKDDRIYGGGNAKGFFTCIDGNPRNGLIQVLFSNGDLSWPLVSFALGQTESWLDKDENIAQISLVVQKNDRELRILAENFLKEYCNEEKLSFQIISPEEAPEQITATPAIVFSNKKGWSLYGGKLNSSASIMNFIRNAQGRPTAPKINNVKSIISKLEGRQTLGIAIKWTGWKGDFEPLEDWEASIKKTLASAWSGTENSASRFLPTDRKYYLDVHPYIQGDSVFLSFAVFSQFNCITPILDRLNSPLTGSIKNKAILIDKIVQQSLQVINEYIINAEFGEALIPIETDVAYKNFDNSSFNIEEIDQASISHDPSLNRNWYNPKPSTSAQPILQFNFPSPLERYAGEVAELDGSLTIDQGLASGMFTADLKTLTMGSKDFDNKVLKDYLIVRKYKNASFQFENQAIFLSWDQSSSQVVQGQLSFLGKDIPLEVTANFYPNSSSSTLSVQIEFVLNIAEPFKLPGPDGPREAKEHLQFFMQFDLELK